MRRGSDWHAWLAPGNQTTTCNKAAGDAAHLVERKERPGRNGEQSDVKRWGSGAHKYPAVIQL